MPGLYACGSLYRPANLKGKVPVILNPDGHFPRGRNREDCQYRCATLAQMGAMAFSYDLFGWDGESQLQVKPEDHRRSLVQSIQALNALRILDFFPEFDTLFTFHALKLNTSAGCSLNFKKFVGRKLFGKILTTPYI